MTRWAKIIIKGALLLLFIWMTLLCSGCKGSKKQQAVRKLSENLRGDYTSEISFTVPEGSSELCGNAQITRSGTTTTLDIHEPEPFAGMSIEYDVKGLPSSVAVHFLGINTAVPSEALSRVNSIAVLFADDFASSIEKIAPESMIEYELENGSTGCCASVPYGDAEVTLYFDEVTGIPLLLEYRSESINTDIVFEHFNPLVEKNEE